MNLLLGNPLIPLIFWVALFLLLWSFRHSWSATISLTVISLLLLLLLLPGGREIASQTAELPTPKARVTCFSDSLLKGSLWSGEPVPSCAYRGRPLLP